MTKILNPRREFLKRSGLLATGLALGYSSCKSDKGGVLEADVVIIGAGLSGLNAALLLQDFGFSSIILEATDRIGGRVFTAKEKDVPGHPELGANGIGGGYARIISAADKYGVKIGPMRNRTEPVKGELIYGIKNELILPDKWATHPLNPFQEEWAKKMAPSSVPWTIYSELNPFPKNDLTAWRSEKYKEWDRSIRSVFKDKGFSEDAIKLSGGINSSYGLNADDTSVLMYFQILNFIGQQMSANTGRGGAAIGGNQRIPEAMANAFKGDIRISSPVKSIDSNNESIKVTLHNDKNIKAKYALVTVPAFALRNIKMSPALDPIQQEGINNLGYTPVTQVHYVPTEKYWEKDGLPPSMWTDSLCGRFMALKNDVNNPERVTSCIAYTNNDVAIKLSNMSETDAINAVTQELNNIRPSTKDALEPVYYWKWANNPYAGGAYAYWKPGQITKFADKFAKPHGRIHFAGEHTAELSRGMEGAMESGERAAMELMSIL